MVQQMAVPPLGQSVLVVMDGHPGYLNALRAATSLIPAISLKFFTLLCCCPARYWEHGGADSPTVRQEIAAMWAAAENDRNRASHCLEQARGLLHAAGVPDSHILAKTITEKHSLIAATLAELGRSRYSGVIISRYHHDIVNRLRRTGITDVFRQLPKVAVLTLVSSD